MKNLLLIPLLLIHSLFSHAGDLIGGIQYGDSEEAVIQKLKKSGLAKAEIDKSMLARTGINGAYETTNTLKGMPFKLYFDWDRVGTKKNLNQITFRSSPIPEGEYDLKLKSAWSYAKNLLNIMYGKPANSGRYPSLNKVSDGGLMYSHVWKNEEGFVYLGIGKEDEKLNLSITFRKDKL